MGDEQETPNGRERQVYKGGKWVSIEYSRPLKRGRELFGTGDAYATKLNAGAPVWRAGADVSTRLKTEAPLVLGGKTLAPGEYLLFIDLKPGAWTLIVSNHKPQLKYDPTNKTEIWGAYGYDAKNDVAAGADAGRRDPVLARGAELGLRRRHRQGLHRPPVVGQDERLGARHARRPSAAPGC